MNSKRPSLTGSLIQRKGEAPRPPDLTASAPAPAAPPPAPAPQRKAYAKALTLKLSEGDYERLRLFAFHRHRTHQDVIEAALLRYLDDEERAG